MKLTTNWQAVDSYVWTHSSGAKITFYLDAKYSKQDITNNKTTIETRLRSVMNVGSASGSGYSYTCSYATPRSGTAIWYFATETILSGSSTITHDSDGSKKLTLTATVANSYLKISGELTGEVELPTIPRASTVLCSSPYIGDVAIITVDKKASTFTSTVTYEIGTLKGTVVDKTSETTISFNTSSLKDEIYALIPSAKKISGTITCTTYSGNTQIGEAATTTFNLYAVEEDCKPSVSGKAVDTNATTIAITGNSSKFIKFLSKPKVTITATAKNSATIKGYSINLNDGQTSSSKEATFDSIGSSSIAINATDSRGYSNPQTLNVEMINYIKLHIDTIDISRTEGLSSEVLLNAKGVWFNSKFSDSKTNTLTAKFQYKLSGASNWTDGGTLTPTKSGNTFTFTNVSLGNIYDHNNEYQFKIILSDLLMTVGSEDKEAITLPKGTAVVEIGEDLVNINGELTVNDKKDLFVKVSSTEPTSGEKVWIQNTKNKMYVANDNGTYVEFLPTSFRGITDNLNNATSSGFYRWTKESTNRPWSNHSAWGCVVVQNDGSWIFQTAYATFDVDNARIAHRGYINGSWTPWCHIPTRDFVNTIKTYQYAYKSFTRVTGNLATGSWVTMCTDLSVTLPVGEYMLIFCPAVTGNASGVVTFNPVIDGTRTSSVTRQTIPIASSLVTNTQCIVPLTVATQKAYTFNVHQYANASSSVSAVGLYIYKLN